MYLVTIACRNAHPTFIKPPCFCRICVHCLLPAKSNSLEEKTRFEILRKRWYPTFFFHCWNALLPSEVWICSLVKAIFLVKPTIFPGQIHIFWVNHSSPHVFDVAKSLLRRCLQSETIQFAQHGILGDSDRKLDFALVEQFHGNVEIWWAITSKSPANKKDIGTPSR